MTADRAPRPAALRNPRSGQRRPRAAAVAVPILAAGVTAGEASSMLRLSL